jgi:hypothetical protein
MKKGFSLTFMSVIGGLLAFSIVAQDGACPVRVEEILAAAGDACGGLGRNEACYGNTNVKTTWRADDAPDFSQLGDIADISDIQTLITSPLDEDSGDWGVALLSLAANLPDTLAGQFVTFVVYGDVSLSADIDAEDAFPAPMQAFRLSTGIGESRCEDAPRDGVLVQAPQNTTVNFLINGVDVVIGSTGLLNMNEDALEISTFDGLIEVSAQGETQEVPRRGGRCG